MLLSELIQKSTDYLKESGSESPRLDAEIIAAFCLGVERIKIIVDNQRRLNASEAGKLKRLFSRRASGEPVAYITGSKEFYSLDFAVNPRVLIPRPETELLVDLAIYYAPLNGRVLDLCTGSGAIAVALKHNRSDLRVDASDISEGALKTAKKNSKNLLGPRAVKFFTGNLFDPLAGRCYDVIVSNPPYIDPRKRDQLQKEISREPAIALFSENAGTEHIRKIIKAASGFLHDDGVLILEIDADSRKAVETSGKEADFSVSIMNDYSSNVRAAVLHRRGA